MDASKKVEISLRAAMVAHDVLNLMTTDCKRVMELMLNKTIEDLAGLKKTIAAAEDVERRKPAGA